MENKPQESPPDPRQLGWYYALAQVGLEMAAPIGLGAWLDHSFGWTPWGAVIGAIVGLVGGILHLLALVKQHDEK